MSIWITDIGKLERGVVRWPGSQRREALRTVLGAACDADLGLYPSRAYDPQPPNGLRFDGQAPRADAGDDVELGDGSRAGGGVVRADPVNELLAPVGVPIFASDDHGWGCGAAGRRGESPTKADRLAQFGVHMAHLLSFVDTVATATCKPETVQTLLHQETVVVKSN